MLKKNNNFIEGSGFLAKKFKKYIPLFKRFNIVLYAAGVSNSLEYRKSEFKREINRISQFIKFNNKKIIYISTCSIFDKSRNHAYVKNKIKIENLIKKNVKSYIIFRLPEIVGFNKNPNTLVNFFYKKIKKRKKFNLWVNAKRNLLDIDDVVKLIIFYIKTYKNKNKIINLLNSKFYKALEIVSLLENIMNKNAVYKIKKIKNYKFKIKNKISKHTIKKLDLKFNNSYLSIILRKYYR